MEPSLYVVPASFKWVECVHPSRWNETAVSCARIQFTAASEELIVLKWQLQLDGTYRKIGKCPRCGRIFVTEEVR